MVEGSLWLTERAAGLKLARYRVIHARTDLLCRETRRAGIEFDPAGSRGACPTCSFNKAALGGKVPIPGHLPDPGNCRFNPPRFSRLRRSFCHFMVRVPSGSALLSILQ
jgi:hypothetical protein